MNAVTRSCGYDGKNDLTKADLATGGEWGTLAHDNLGRLASATGFGLTNTLGYDAYGNNTSSTATGNVPSSFTAFTFNPLADNQMPGLTSSGSLTGWSHNARGEALSAGTGVGTVPALGFTWDGLGRLNATVLAGVSQTYGYLPSGMRFQLTDSADASKNRRYAYTSGGLLLGEYTGSGSTWNWKRDVIYLGGEAIAEIDGAGTHELHKDHLGSPRIITSGGGAIEGTQAFGPYGEAFPAPYTTGYVPLTGYTGHVQTDTTGLIYMRGRFYSPAWHRFINSDQGVDPNSWNQFAYVGGSPFQATDPSGMDWLKVTTGGRMFQVPDWPAFYSLMDILYGAGNYTYEVISGVNGNSTNVGNVPVGTGAGGNWGPATGVQGGGGGGPQPQSPKKDVDCEKLKALGVTADGFQLMKATVAATNYGNSQYEAGFSAVYWGGSPLPVYYPGSNPTSGASSQATLGLPYPVPTAPGYSFHVHPNDNVNGFSSNLDVPFMTNNWRTGNHLLSNSHGLWYSNASMTNPSAGVQIGGAKWYNSDCF